MTRSGIDPRSRRDTHARYERPNASPFRHLSRSLAPVGNWRADDHAALAADLARRIRGHRHRTQSGTYVLGDPDGDVYVLADAATTTRPLLARHMQWYVGSYALGSFVTFPTPDDVLDDLTCHFAEILKEDDHG